MRASEFKEALRDGMGMTLIVRVNHNDYAIILRCLEPGAKGVIVPRIRSPEEVQRAVEWVK